MPARAASSAASSAAHVAAPPRAPARLQLDGRPLAGEVAAAATMDARFRPRGSFVSLPVGAFRAWGAPWHFHPIAIGKAWREANRERRPYQRTEGPRVLGRAGVLVRALAHRQPTGGPPASRETKAGHDLHGQPSHRRPGRPFSRLALALGLALGLGLGMGMGRRPRSVHVALQHATCSTRRCRPGVMPRSSREQRTWRYGDICSCKCLRAAAVESSSSTRPDSPETQWRISRMAKDDPWTPERVKRRDLAPHVALCGQFPPKMESCSGSESPLTAQEIPTLNQPSISHYPMATDDHMGGQTATEPRHRCDCVSCCLKAM